MRVALCSLMVLCYLSASPITAVLGALCSVGVVWTETVWVKRPDARRKRKQQWGTM